mgnify:CR=1 FL=1
MKNVDADYLRFAALMAANNEPPEGPRREDGDGESKTGIVTKTRPKRSRTYIRFFF